ncbi:MAG: hypothetical protein JO071_02890, partial [Deltaproteobacteria bacterium]|nr:hypothetical protein [Deltaproteobacteria bacterium]
MNSAIRSTLIACACSILIGPVYAAQMAADPGRTDRHAESGMIEQAPAPKPLDYGRLTQEAAALLSKYIQIDTTNPPGNELPAAKL